MHIVLAKEKYELRTGVYASGHRSLNLICSDGSPVVEFSLDLPGVAQSPDEIILKTYGENQEIAAQIVTAKILIPTPRHVLIGGYFCPVCDVTIVDGNDRLETTPVSEEEVLQPLTPLPRACAAIYPPGQSPDSH